MSRVCKFYLQGNCKFGSSCRFLHPDNRTQRSDNQYYDEYRPRRNNNVNRQYYDNNTKGRSYKGYDQNESQFYEPNIKNDRYWNKDYNSRNNYKDNYQSQEERAVNNYFEQDEYSMDRNMNSNRRNYKYKNEIAHQSNNENNQEYYTSNYNDPSNLRYIDSDNHLDNKYKYERANIREKEKFLKKYEVEIKSYQAAVKENLNRNIWPFTCFNPIGQTYPIQSVGCLNLIEASFEEIRCDYYLAKTICADPGLIHKQVLEELLCKARQQKEDIISFGNKVQDDMIATFEKLEQSKNNSMFHNSIQMDQNSYWDMSVRRLTTPQPSKSQLESFSFVNKEENPKSKISPLKIIMQTEIYGKTDCDEFANENFTAYIPIMPPPEKYCL